MNNYLILSDDKVIIDLKIEEIIKKIKETDKEIIKMDLSEKTVDDLLEELNTYNFLSNLKVVIAYNSLFLEGDSSNDKSINKIIKYIDSKSDNILILVASKTASRKTLTELLSKLEVIEGTISTELLVKRNLEDYKMENRDVKYLIEYCHKNNERIITELEKLKLYKLEDKIITKEDIDKVVFKEYDDNIFDLVNAITARNRKKSVELYTRLIEKEEPTLIVASIANKIRMLYSIKVLRDDKVKQSEMAEIMNVKPAAISISMEQCDNFSKDKLLKLLYELSEIDYKSKTTGKNLDLQFKLFLMNI